MWSFARTCMKELASVALVAGALVFAAAAPGQAQGIIGHGSRPETSRGGAAPARSLLEVSVLFLLLPVLLLLGAKVLVLLPEL